MGHLSVKDHQRTASSAWPHLEWRLVQITSRGPFMPTLHPQGNPSHHRNSYQGKTIEATSTRCKSNIHYIQYIFVLFFPPNLQVLKAARSSSAFMLKNTIYTQWGHGWTRITCWIRFSRVVTTITAFTWWCPGSWDGFCTCPRSEQRGREGARVCTSVHLEV